MRERTCHECRRTLPLDAFDVVQGHGFDVRDTVCFECRKVIGQRAWDAVQRAAKVDTVTMTSEPEGFAE